MRAILVDWLVEVHSKYRLQDEALWLTVQIVDRYLQTTQVMRNRLQLIGVAAMLIAAKFEEIHPPEVRDFAYITDNTYSKLEILDMEAVILNAFVPIHRRAFPARDQVSQVQALPSCSCSCSPEQPLDASKRSTTAPVESTNGAHDTV